MGSALATRLGAEIQGPLVLRAALAALPLVFLFWYTGNPLWLQASIVTMSVLIAEERVKLAPAGVLLHGLVIMACFALLLWALHMPWVFVIASAMMAAATIRMAGQGRRLRTLGNFTFIPALYLACEFAEPGASRPLRDTLHTVLPYQCAALLPVLIIALWHHLADDRPADRPRHRHHLRLGRTGDFGEGMSYGEAMVAIAIAVGLASVLVLSERIDHGQWVIWSAASVVTGQAVTSRHKLRDRTVGALVGVPAGLVLGAWLPHTAFSYGIASLATMLTLVAFRRYIIGFGARCACIAITLTIAGQAASIAAERVVNVVAGGLIGVACVLLVGRVAQRYARRGNYSDT